MLLVVAWLEERLAVVGGGAGRGCTDAQVEEVVVRTLEEVPEGAARWSKRELAKRVGISPASVLRIWHAFGLQPWRTEAFKISPDPLLVGFLTRVSVPVNRPHPVDGGLVTGLQRYRVLRGTVILGKGQSRGCDSRK